MDKTTHFHRYDHKIGYNVQVLNLFCDPGEYRVCNFGSVEELRFNNGFKGQIILTNIRIIWLDPINQSMNLYIGFNSIKSVSKSDFSKKREKITIMAYRKTKSFEFHFMIKKKSESLYDTINKLISNYRDSFYLREYKLRSSVFKDENLILLKNESVIHSFNGVSTISGNSSKTGRLILTNYRFVWTSTVVNSFNVSIPFWAIPPISIQDHPRFEHCFYVLISISKRNFMYGFTAYPSDSLIKIVDSVERLRLSSSNSPMITYPISIHGESQKEPPIYQIISDDSQETPSDLFLSLCVHSPSSDQIIYDSTLGLSIEETSSMTPLYHILSKISNTSKLSLAESTLLY